MSIRPTLDAIEQEVQGLDRDLLRLRGRMQRIRDLWEKAQTIAIHDGAVVGVIRPKGVSDEPPSRPV